VLIREASEDDLPRVARLRLEFLAAHRGADANSFPDRLRVETEAFLRRHQNAGSIRSWLAVDDGRDLGVVTMLLLDLAPRPEDASGMEGYIVNMYVHPSQRRHGIGRALLDRCLDAAAALSLRRLLLYATDDGRPLYTHAGFATNPNWMELDLR
jgi:GNAT superfamily N-acetyltransferase